MRNNRNHLSYTFNDLIQNPRADRKNDYGIPYQSRNAGRSDNLLFNRGDDPLSQDTRGQSKTVMFWSN